MTYIKNEIGALIDGRKIFSQKKEKFEEISKKNKEYEKWINCKKDENIKKIKKEIENIQKFNKEIEKNKDFLIQIERNNDSNSKINKNFCKFNIVLNNNKSGEKENQSKIKIKNSWIDLSSEFKTIDNILEEFYNTKVEDSNLKILTLIQNMKKDIKECSKFYDDILTKIYNGNYKNRTLMNKLSNEYNKKIIAFNKNVRYESIKAKLGNDIKWFDEFLIYILELFILKKPELDYEENTNPFLIF